MKEINSLKEIPEDSYFIFKHSAICSISFSAYEAVTASEGRTDLPFYLVVVQTHRTLCDEIAEHFGIPHKSPQLILIRDGAAQWEASHFRITTGAIEKAANGD